MTFALREALRRRGRRTFRRVARILRTALPDGVFHVTTLGVDHGPVFRDGLDRTRFLALLWECVERFDWELYAYCLMTTHYHLVLEATVEAMARGMHRLNGIHALTFNRRYKRWGHLFGDRYASRVVDNDEYLAAALDYVLQPRPRRSLRPTRAVALERLASTLHRPQTEHMFVRRPADTMGRLWRQKSW